MRKSRLDKRLEDAGGEATFEELYPDWEVIDCGCCNGLQWGGESPVECNDCGGLGSLYRHKPSGLVCLYPGGPIRYREKPTALAEAAR